MAVVLEWLGDAASVLALDACLARGAEVALRLPRERPGVPDFVLEDQAAALGLPATDAPPTAAPTPNGRTLEDLVARGHRAVVVACRAPLDAAFLGRVVDAQLLRDVRLAGADDHALETLVFDGPRFRRRVDLVVLDAEPEDYGWRLPVGLRGC